jgi:G3E family GTPase
LDFNKLNTFLKRLPSEVIRVKGVLNLEVDGVGRKYLLQYVGERSEIIEESWSDLEKKYSAVVCVGKGMDKSALQTQLDDCVF